MAGDKYPYRLGLDVGSNSLGWFVVRLDGEGRPVGLGLGGVRIYPDGRDPQSKSSNAVTRRVARGSRRRRDRYLKRRTNVMALLVAHGLMPAGMAERKKLEQLDPFELRARALDEALPAHHVGRALFHLNQRRGFLSNRKTEKEDSETGAIKEAAGKLEAAMQATGARTLGEFLHGRHQKREFVRARNRSAEGKAEYDFYPTRQMVRAEFDAIWDKQEVFHPAMTPEARAAIAEDINGIFYQRRLTQPPVGKCALDPAHDNNDADGFRCPWAHPLAQRFRIWQEVRNLAVEDAGRKSRRLTKEEGDKIALALIQNSKVSFAKITQPAEIAVGRPAQLRKRQAARAERRRDRGKALAQGVVRQGVAGSSVATADRDRRAAAGRGRRGADGRLADGRGGARSGSGTSSG